MTLSQNQNITLNYLSLPSVCDCERNRASKLLFLSLMAMPFLSTDSFDTRFLIQETIHYKNIIKRWNSPLHAFQGLRHFGKQRDGWLRMYFLHC